MLCFTIKNAISLIKRFNNYYAGMDAACFDLRCNGNIKSHDKYFVFIAKWYTTRDASKPTTVPAIICTAELRMCKKVAKNIRVPLPAKI